MTVSFGMIPYVGTPIRIINGILLLMASGVCQSSDLERVQRTYRTILQSTDDSQIPKVEALSKDLEGLDAVTDDEVRSLFPIARLCWRSPRLEVRLAGVDLIMAVSRRPNSADLLEPVFPDLEALMAEPEPVWSKAPYTFLA